MESYGSSIITGSTLSVRWVVSKVFLSTPYLRVRHSRRGKVSFVVVSVSLAENS